MKQTKSQKSQNNENKDIQVIKSARLTKTAQLQSQLAQRKCPLTRDYHKGSTQPVNRKWKHFTQSGPLEPTLGVQMGWVYWDDGVLTTEKGLRNHRPCFNLKGHTVGLKIWTLQPSRQEKVLTSVLFSSCPCVFQGGPFRKSHTDLLQWLFKCRV